MSDSTDLRRIVGAMTESPWSVHYCGDREDGQACGVCTGCDEDGRCGGFADILGSDARDECTHPCADTDATAIVTLANHAEALVGLVEAGERFRELMPQAMTANQVTCFMGILAALARVEAVK